MMSRSHREAEFDHQYGFAMKLDLDLIRELLVKLEEKGSSHETKFVRADDEDMAVEGFDLEQIEYHLAQLWKSGLIETGGSGSGIGASGDFFFRDLTWSGHEFVNAVRGKDVWQKTKDRLKPVGGWTLGIAGDVAKAIFKEQVKNHTGLDF